MERTLIGRFTKSLKICQAALALLLIDAWARAAFGDPSIAKFRFEVRPILSKTCFSCHGPDESHREAGLRLDVRDVPIEMGVVVPGDPDNSEILRRITSKDPAERMPPPETGRRLSDEDITKIRQWIADGAAYSQHWSYEPPLRPPVPNVSNPAWCRNEIDYFVLARLDRARIEPQSEADRYQLIRRLSLDLTGLPPTVEESEQFVNDKLPDCYERLVDRLLASPAYGENSARKWLDLARYADSNGYEQDKRRTSWPYRDWVIKAFNSDMPFDRFTIEQIAGDLLPEPTEDQLIATTFHRNTMQNDEGGTDDEEFRVAAVVDRVDTTMQVWMGTTMGCCRCHSHKYDPFSQTEYYQLFAFFNQSADADRDDGEPTLGTTWKRLHPVTEVAEGSATSDDDRDVVVPKDLRRSKLPIMQELPPNKQRTTHVHIRGNFLDWGEVVEPNTPAVFPKLPRDAPRSRLGLARWLVDPNNPLTARVTVNRQWEQLFGSGIVFTCEDFGSQGMLPTNPELLDWLAVDFMENGWSLKCLTKSIVMSATYRQSSRITPTAIERDPDNRLLSRGSRERLSAEQIRDQALAVSGLLSRKIGGPSVMPRQPDGIWQMVYNEDRWETSAGADRYRRGLYTFWRRTSPYPSAMAFDATSRETCTIRRVSTNTPVAAFALLNDPVYVEAAQALAKRIIASGHDNPADQVSFGFREVLVRPPAKEEIQRLVDLFHSEQDHYRKDPKAAAEMANLADEPSSNVQQVADLAAWTVVSNVLLNLDETITK